MKFITESVSRCAARLGFLSEFERMPDLIFETPLVMVHTKRGSVPHLTKDVFHMLTTDPHILSLSLPSCIRMTESIQQAKVSFAEFVSMKEYPNFMTIHDPAEPMSRGHQKHDSISVWSKHGRHSINPDQYMEIVEAFKPDMYVALCDGDTDETSSDKRISKTVERSRAQFLKCYEKHKSSEIMKNRGLIGPVEGGYDLEARERSIKYLLDKNLNGFVIDGLHINGPSVQKIQYESIKNVVQHTINLLPIDKMKISLGCWNPAVVLELIDTGVDIFDSSYPYVITESWKALTFMCIIHNHSNNEGPLISMEEQRFVDDFTPICESCECLTCQNHSKAYLKHLYHTKELLGFVLLMIHNTHQYLQFFKAIRQNLKDGTFSAFKSKICQKFAATN
ncbi:hypothetical protein PV325_008106 [Microctonus aethiopoides]|uniref:Queuine tRNA-ribosyltransferase accessory subunit 2 n=1 Tax=Microctonus aethiopoides TaxID=144406 RepID=A0AA39KXI1_9HYME|nr:hypothetical protein PV325_008106 [Microctonus aethiopoides]KAK0088624.1 hypothetical protein PV326_004769 [Microctonus aethiopoides]KAK0177400.1 hypothetical protein PV328_001457 [Microctonus aethiopoides]